MDSHLYFDTIYYPLEDAEIEDLENRKLPDADDAALYLRKIQAG